MKNITFVQDQGMHAFNFTAKKVALACNSCAGWVGGAGNLIAVPAVNSPRTKYWLRRQLFPVGRTSYYTVFEFYEDRHRAARRVFAETTYRFRYTPRFSRLVGRKPPGFWIETRVTRFPWHTATKLLRAALK